MRLCGVGGGGKVEGVMEDYRKDYGGGIEKEGKKGVSRPFRNKTMSLRGSAG